MRLVRINLLLFALNFLLLEPVLAIWLTRTGSEGDTGHSRSKDIKQVAILLFDDVVQTFPVLPPSGLSRFITFGAGAAGSSASWHLHRFAEATALVDVNITVFERSSHIGGRSTTVNAFHDPLFPVELGASVFVEVNRILKNAVDEFDLRTTSCSTGEELEILGVWNGEEFVFTQKEGGWAWWDNAKLVWKYGLAPIKTQRLMRATLAKFLKLYEPPFFPFRSLSDRVGELDLISTTAVTDWRSFCDRHLQANTRLNYGQNLGIINGLETMVCMAVEGAMQVEGGNWQIFDRMLNASGANILLNTTVTQIIKEEEKYIVSVASSRGLSEGASITSQKFDTVILAAPLQFSEISIESDTLKHVPDVVPYVRLHVTLFASPHRLNAGFFNLKSGQEVPTTILTTLSSGEDPTDRTKIVGKAGFFSISTLRSVINPRTLRKEYLYGIFSPEKVTSEFLEDLFNIQLPKDIGSLVDEPTEEITWYYPYVFYSYPYGLPRVTFEELELSRGLYYTSGIESFISTMETSALMGMNIAQLVIDDFVELLGGTPNYGSHPDITREKSPVEEL